MKAFTKISFESFCDYVLNRSRGYTPCIMHTKRKGKYEQQICAFDSIDEIKLWLKHHGVKNEPLCYIAIGSAWLDEPRKAVLLEKPL